MIAEIKLAPPRKVSNRPNYRRAAQYAHNARRCIYHGVILGSRRRRGENWLASSARCLTRTISTLHRWQRDHAMAWQTLKMTTVPVDLLLFENWNEAIDHHVRTEVRGFIEAMPEEALPAALGRGPRYGPREATANGNATQARRAPTWQLRAGADGNLWRDDFGSTREVLREGSNCAHGRRARTFLRHIKATHALEPHMRSSGRLAHSNAATRRRLRCGSFCEEPKRTWYPTLLRHRPVCDYSHNCPVPRDHSPEGSNPRCSSQKRGSPASHFRSEFSLGENSGPCAN